MPSPDSFPSGAPCWVDLYTSDLERSHEFYGRLLGWTVDDPGPAYGGYVNYLSNGAPVAGCMRNDGQGGTDDVWSVYLMTDDVQAVADATPANGGQVIVPPMDVLELGRMAVVADAGGASVGAWQPGSHRGFGVVAEPGAPTWFEVRSRAYEQTLQFYRRVFGWDTRVVADTPELRSATFGAGDRQDVGITDAATRLPDGAPSAWSVSFGVRDTDAAVAEVVSLGGAVLEPAADGPSGRLARVSDPGGAVFELIGLPEDRTRTATRGRRRTATFTPRPRRPPRAGGRRRRPRRRPPRSRRRPRSRPSTRTWRTSRRCRTRRARPPARRR